MLNAEDQACVESGNRNDCWDKSLEQSIKGIEQFIGAKQSFLNVVALLDGPNFGGAAKDVTRYLVQPNGNYTLGANKWELDEVNMGDPKTVVDFTNWAIANYPADHYFMAIDDHGGGISGTSWDSNDVGSKKIDDNLTPAELRAALKEITNNGQRKIDIFDFESCLMGMVENAYDLKDYVDYIALFQSISWTSINYPEYFKDLTASDTVEAVARRIIQRYPVTSTNEPYTFGLAQSSKLEDVRVKLDAFAGALMGANLATLNTIRNQTQAFNGTTNKGDASQDSQGYLDLWDFASRVKAAGIAGSQADALKAAIDAAVIEKKAVVKGRSPVWDYSNYHGLSIAYPNRPFTSITAYCRDYALSGGGNGGWAKFITTKVFTGYDFKCGGSVAGLQSTSLQQASKTPTLLGPTILEPKPQALTTIYLPIVAR
jgi:hypothetical protein